jgi:hypothetical protein
MQRINRTISFSVFGMSLLSSSFATLARLVALPLLLLSSSVIAQTATTPTATPSGIPSASSVEEAMGGTSNTANPGALGPGATGKPVVSSKCTDTIKSVFEDIAKIYAPNQVGYRSSYQWKKLAWLSNSLGDPNTTKDTQETLYRWGKYGALVREGRVVQTYGRFPGRALIRVPNGPDSAEVFLAQARQQLGDPEEITKTTTTQITWICEDPRITLTAIVDEQGTVTGVGGTYCLPTNCLTFGAPGDPSSLVAKLQQLNAGK